MEETVYDGGWLKVKKTPRGYLYAERKGRDSIAVLLYRFRKSPGFLPVIEVFVRMQPLPVGAPRLQNPVKIKHVNPFAKMIEPLFLMMHLEG